MMDFLISAFTPLVRRGLGLVCVLFISSCAPLPDYARPKFYSHPETAEAGATGFTYRVLQTADFKAPALPPDYQQYRDSINARSCLSIRPSGITNAQISRVPYYGNLISVGTFTQISFEALFIPSCSWWNHALSEKKTGYVLQHEQIHFAIAELTARRVTRELTKKMQGYTAVGGADAEVRDELMKVLLDSAHEIIAADLKVHTDFDEDTSMFFDQDEQNSWFNQIEKRLALETVSR